MRRSIVQSKKECWFCGTVYGLHMHHIYPGRNRRVSDQHGFVVWLCAHHHNMSDSGVHFDKKKDLLLKRECQRVYETSHSRAEFLGLIGRNYLEDL